jgi:superfamily II DNA or RNA helicase
MPGPIIAGNLHSNTRLDSGRAIYAVRDRLADGGFGTVYVCELIDGVLPSFPLGAKVAVKVLTQGSEIAQRRFRAEMASMDKLSKQFPGQGDAAGILPVLDYGILPTTSDHVTRFFVMPLLESDFPFPGEGLVWEKLDTILAVVRTLSKVHARHGPHRDIKPSNLMVDRTGKVWILDFGLATRGETTTTTDTLGTTQVGLGGTENYSAPEQLLSQPIENIDLLRRPALDVYPIGLILYHALTGNSPFDASSEVQELCRKKHPLPARCRIPLQVAFDTLEIKVSSEVVQPLQTAILHAIEPDPERRAADLSQLQSTLEQYLQAALPALDADENVDVEEEVGALDDADTKLGEALAEALPSVINDLLPVPGTVELRSWQQAAIQAWEAAGRRGVVEAVTGTGKSRVGVEVVRRHVELGGKAVVVVPTTALLKQWINKEFGVLTPEIRVGQLGGGSHAALSSHMPVVVTTIQSLDSLNIPKGTLLVADECHRYGGVDGLALQEGKRKGGAWASTLRKKVFGPRLGLTATLQRSDGGDQDILVDSVGPRVYHLGFKEALEQQPEDAPWIAKFKLGFLRIPFTRVAREKYETFCGILTKKRSQLIALGCPSTPFGAFIAAVQKMSQGGRGAIPARIYLSNFSKRRALLADDQQKLAAFAELGQAIKNADRTLVFTETIETAKEVHRILEQQGIPSITLTGGTKGKTRILSNFRSGRYRVVVAPKVLDEGINVPNADLGIVVCGSRSKRQMIQRLGRILRPKNDGRIARFLFLVMENSVEDPEAEGGSPEFISEVHEARPVDNKTFTTKQIPALIKWLKPESGEVSSTAPSAMPQKTPVDNVQDKGHQELSAAWTPEIARARLEAMVEAARAARGEGKSPADNAQGKEQSSAKPMYHYHGGPTDQAELDIQEIANRVAAAPQGYHHHVWKAGMAGWTRAEDVPEIAALLPRKQEGGISAHTIGDSNLKHSKTSADNAQTAHQVTPSSGRDWAQAVRRALPSNWSSFQDSKGRTVFTSPSSGQYHIARLQIYKRHVVGRVRSRTCQDKPSKLKVELYEDSQRAGTTSSEWFEKKWRIEDQASLKVYVNAVLLEWQSASPTGVTSTPHAVGASARRQVRQVLVTPEWKGDWEQQKLMPRSRKFRLALAQMADEGLLVDPEWEGDRSLKVRWPNGEVAQLFYLYGSGPWVDIGPADPESYANLHGGYMREDKTTVVFGWKDQQGAALLIRAILGG